MKGEKHLLYPEEVREAAINRTCSRAQCCRCVNRSRCKSQLKPDAAHLCVVFEHEEVKVERSRF